MNHTNGKSKLKVSEPNKNESGGVRFMNKGISNQKLLARNSCMPMTNMPPRNDMLKNSQLKPRINNNVNSMNNNNNNNQTFHNTQKHNLQKFQPSQSNAMEEGSHGGKMFHPHNARNSMYDFSKQAIQTSSTNNNLMEESFNKPRAVRKTVHENVNLKKNEPNHNVQGNNTGNNNNNNNNNKMYKNTNMEINESNTKHGMIKKTYNQQSGEMENSENYNMNNSETFVNMLCSPMKRKFDNYEHVNDMNPDDVKGSSNKKFLSRNAMNAEPTGNYGNERNKNRNVQMNNVSFNADTTSNNKGNNPSNFYNGIDPLDDSLMNSYEPYTNDHRYTKNNNVSFMGSHNMKMNNQNKFNTKNHPTNQKYENEQMNRSFPMGNKNNELFTSGALNKNYTNYERNKNNMYNIVGPNNNEMNHRPSYYVENNTNPEHNKMKTISEIREYSVHKNGTLEGVNMLQQSIVKTNKNENCLKETLSEKMEDSNHLHPVAASFDHLSDDNFKINRNRKMDRSDDHYSMLNPFYNLNQNESNPSFLDASSNVANQSIISNGPKLAGMLINQSEDLHKLNLSSSNKPVSSEKESLLNLMIDSSQTGKKEKNDNEINGSMESKQDPLGRTNYNSGMTKVYSNEVRTGKTLKMNKGGNKINLKTVELNDRDFFYFKDVLHNLSNYSIENDTVGIYTNIVNLNKYALNFQYENEYIDEILNVKNNITQCNQEIKRIMMNKKKVIQDKRNAVNEEYEAAVQKLKECEDVFCDADENTGSHKFKLFHDIEEKKNKLIREYEEQRMQAQKIKYKTNKLKEEINKIKRDTEALTKSYKKKYQLLQSILRVKVMQNTGDTLTVCLIPKNTDKEVWHRIKIDKNQVTPQICNYLWKQIESFADEEYMAKHS